MFYPEGPSQVLTVSSGPDDESDDGSRAGTRQLEAGGKLPGQGAVVVAASGDRRDRLPVDQPKSYGFSIWSVLRQAIGRDLTRITMPATINEPLSSVQRIAEELEYRDLLHNALAAPDPIEQLLWVAVFVLSSYGSSLPRVNKPFNPLLGETFEWEAPEGDVAFVCEQVSHHPPISCWHAEGQVPPTRGTLDAGSTTDGGSYQLSGEIEARSRFWGKSIDIVPTGTSFLRLAPRHGPEQVFSYCKATCTIHNIIWGKPYIDWSGEVIVQNRTTGDFARLQLPKCNGRLGERGVVEGAVCSREGVPQYTLSGSYTDQLVAAMTSALAGSRGVQHGKPWVVFTASARPPWSPSQYSMTSLALHLNQLLPEHASGRLPPTDSRYRPDQRCLEDGEWDKATGEKLRLEEKQRAARKVRAAAGQEYKPMWFDLQRKAADGSMVMDPDGDLAPCWSWNGQYKQRTWAACPDIYSEHMPVVPA